MDWNKYLVNSCMLLGYYDVQRTYMAIERSKLITSHIIRLIIFINAIKMAIIALNVWVPNLKLYLIEGYILAEKDQKQLDIGIAAVQIGFYFSYSYLIRLNQNIEQLKCFNFFFLLNSNDLYQYYSRHYNLSKKDTDEFRRKFNFFFPFLGPILIFYNAFLGVGILRCVYFSYHYVSPTYFFTACLLLAMITAITYGVMAFFFSTGFIMIFLSAELLILRLKAINRSICKQFRRNAHLASPSDPIKIRRQRAGVRRILHSLDNFFRQYSEINSILDWLLSRLMLGLYIGFYGFPYFMVFAEIPMGIRLFLTALIFLTSLLAFSIPIYNSKLKKEASNLPRIGLLCRNSSSNEFELISVSPLGQGIGKHCALYSAFFQRCGNQDFTQQFSDLK